MGHLLERGIYLRGALISKFSKTGIGLSTCVLELNITILYLKNTEFSTKMNTFECSEQNCKENNRFSLLCLLDKLTS